MSENLGLDNCRRANRRVIPERGRVADELGSLLRADHWHCGGESLCQVRILTQYSPEHVSDLLSGLSKLIGGSGQQYGSGGCDEGRSTFVGADTLGQRRTRSRDGEAGFFGGRDPKSSLGCDNLLPKIRRQYPV